MLFANTSVSPWLAVTDADRWLILKDQASPPPPSNPTPVVAPAAAAAAAAAADDDDDAEGGKPKPPSLPAPAAGASTLYAPPPFRVAVGEGVPLASAALGGLSRVVGIRDLWCSTATNRCAQCKCVCVRVCVHVCVHVCVRVLACVCVCVCVGGGCVHTCMCLHTYALGGGGVHIT